MIWVQNKYLLQISYSLRNFKQKNSNLYNFSCYRCGDSKKKQFRARGYIYLKDNEYFYRCHNCGYGTNFAHFLQEINPTIYTQYLIESFGKQPDTRFPHPEQL